MHACMHACIHTYIHTYIHSFINACMHTTYTYSKSTYLEYILRVVYISSRIVMEEIFLSCAQQWDNWVK